MTVLDTLDRLGRTVRDTLKPDPLHQRGIGFRASVL
ncbi:hypothetical protein M2275_006169 [Rhodococcus opacus]|nr:hypothetical protein [Rhodococcus opacus]